MKRFFTISFFLVILLFAGFMELYAQEHINSYNVWAMAVMEKGQEQPAILMYTSPVETAENGLEYHRITYRNRRDSNGENVYTTVKLQYGYRMADKKIFIYDFENKKETLAFDFNISEGDHFTTFNGMEWEVVAVNDTTIDTTIPNHTMTGSVSSKKLLTVKTLDGKFSDQWLEDFGSFANHLMIRSLENIEFSQTLWMEYDMGEYVAREINADPFFTHDTGWMISDDGFHHDAYTKCKFENGNVVFEDVSLYPWEHRAYSVFYRKGDDIYRISMLEFEPQGEGNSALRKDVTTFKGLPAPVSGKYTVHLGNSSYTTGITGINKDSQQKNNSYDLQGRAVNSPTNGIYINNGRKAIVK